MPAERDQWRGLSPTQMVGLMLWRGGLLLVASYALWRGARLALTYADLPTQLEVGLGLAVAGAALVLGSLVAERVQDARREELSE